MIRIVPLAALCALAGCSTAMDQGGSASASASASAATTAPASASAANDKTTVGRADLKDAAGTSVATATVTRAGADLRVAVSAAGLPPGVHGIHLHTTGKCDAPDFTTAGGHWNPMGKMHGRDNPAGMHDGDLPNITIDAAGKGVVEAVIPGGARDGNGALMDGDGATIVVHAAADDMRTDPSGNSGARIACGVLQAGI